MFKIGDFSQLGQVSTRMLRHYDQMGLLVPNHTDPWTGYRYYTLDQLAQLHRIIALKELGLSLPQIAELVGKNELPLAQLRGMLMLKQAEVRQTVEEEQMRLQRIQARLAQIEHEGDPSPYEVVVKSLPATAVASIRTTVPTLQEMGHFCELLCQHVYAGLAPLGIRPLHPELVLYHAEEYRETDLDVEAAVAIHPKYISQPPASPTLTFRELPAHDLVASLIYEGPLREVVPAVLALLSWVGRNNHVPCGPFRELHLSGPAHIETAVDDAAMVTELQVPIAKIG